MDWCTLTYDICISLEEALRGRSRTLSLPPMSCTPLKLTSHSSYYHITYIIFLCTLLLVSFVFVFLFRLFLLLHCFYPFLSICNVSVGYSPLFLPMDFFATHRLHCFFLFFPVFAWSFRNYISIFCFLWLVGCLDLSFQFKPNFAFTFSLSGLCSFLLKLILFVNSWPWTILLVLPADGLFHYINFFFFFFHI